MSTRQYEARSAYVKTTADKNPKWFDKDVRLSSVEALTIPSRVEGQIQMRIRTLLTGVTEIQNSKPAADFRTRISHKGTKKN